MLHEKESFKKIIDHFLRGRSAVADHRLGKTKIDKSYQQSKQNPNDCFVYKFSFHTFMCRLGISRNIE